MTSSGRRNRANGRKRGLSGGARRDLLAVFLVIVLAVAAACRPSPPMSSASPSASPRVVTRNVEAADYAGSEACARCHADVAHGFAASPMHRMTRNIHETTVSAPFQGESLVLGDDRATLETKGGARFVRVDSAVGDRTRTYIVTRVIGGRHREDFVGVEVPSEVEGDVASAVSRAGEHDEIVLPVSYLVDRKRLRYKGYSVMVHERPHLAAGPVWNRTCPFCHNTVPLLSTLFATLLDSSGASFGGPHARGYQGEVVDRLLPRHLAFRYEVADANGLRDALSREIARIAGDGAAGATAHGPLPLSDTLPEAITTTRDRFTGSKLLEVGIGCEACHGGCREHVADPSVHPSLLPRAPYLAVRAGNGGRRAEPSSAADIEDHACARCHQVLFSRYPWTWEGGRRNDPGNRGGSHISSGEARDLLLGGCRGALRCSACHDPHAPDEAAHLAELATPKGNQVCLTCHAALRTADALRAHSHHDPTGAGGACIACHMAKKNLSLDGALSRYHRIGSPTDTDRVLGDRPLECALCHADRSVLALVTSMETWWGKRYDRQVLDRMYGDLDANALRATVTHGKPHEKPVALFVLGRARDRSAGGLFAAELGDEYPMVRDYAADALRATYGDACDLDLSKDRATVAAAMARCAAVTGFPVDERAGKPSGAGSARAPAAHGEDAPVED